MRGKNTQNIVMIADDDLFVRKVLSSAFADIATVVEAQDGAEVEMLYTQYMPDILFLDLHLPHISGMELAEKLLQKDKDAHIVMISSDSSADNVRDAKLKGIKSFLGKPFTKERVIHHFHQCPTIKFSDHSVALKKEGNQ